MPNRYGSYAARQDDSGGDWFDQNRPGGVFATQQNVPLVQLPPGGGTPVEQGGIAGTNTTVQPPAGSTLPPLNYTPGSTWAGNQPSATTWQTPSGTATSAVGGPDQFGGNYEQWFRALVGDRPWNQQTLNNLMPTLQHYGINLTPPNAAGDQTKIQLPNGQWVRVGFGEGHPVWIPQTDTQGNSLFGGRAQGAWGSLAGELGGPPPFQAPTLEQLQQTPGYQARMQMGQQALERSAAAKGSLLSGGFQQALNRYAQNFASNEYQNAFQNALAGYGTNVSTQSQLPWSRYMDLLGMGQSSAGTLGQLGKVPPLTS